jgi:DNA replication ATP-dependent helicase Dna2
LFSHFWNNCYPSPPEPLHANVKAVYFKKKTEVSSFEPYTEGLLVDIQMNDYTFTFIDEKEGDMHRLAHWNVSDRNELFNKNILSVHKHFELPVSINLIESEVSKEGEFYPRAVVIHPDFLVDVTSVAECFKENGSYPMIYILNKFRDDRPKTPVLVGNIVNFLFEEIFYHNEGTLSELKEKIFRKFALGLSLLSDLEMKDVWDQLGRHFVNLKKVIGEDLPAAGIRKESAYLETSFFSRKYGIQGRLDLFVHDEQKQTFAIVELKSGSPWKPNVYGISASHFAQTQIYELLVKSVYDETSYPVKNYILYSKTEQQPLRFAPAIKPHHWEILRVRNEIVILEHLLSKVNNNPGVFESINRHDLSFATGFMTEPVDMFEKTYRSLSPLEKIYFLHSLAFISREY